MISLVTRSLISIRPLGQSASIASHHPSITNPPFFWAQVEHPGPAAQTALERSRFEVRQQASPSIPRREPTGSILLSDEQLMMLTLVPMVGVLGSLS